MSALVFSMLTLTIGVPSAVKTFNWLGTLWGGKIRFTRQCCYAIGFVSLFVSGGITGFFWPDLDRYPAARHVFRPVGHFHLIMGVAAIFGIFGGTYYWFPKMFGRMMNESLGKLHFWLTFIGVNAIFMPMHIMGIMGHPRRYAQGTEFQYLNGNPDPITCSSPGRHSSPLAAQFIFLFNFFWSLFKGKKASDNPWEATTLEWTIPSPPPHDNFAGKIPVVHHGPYEYGVPGAPKDFVMQTDQPLKVGKA